MKSRKNLVRLISLFLVSVSLFIWILPVGAAEPRTSTNGSSSTDVYYNNKHYTIYIGLGGMSSKIACSGIECPVANITIYIGGVYAKFDTHNYGYTTNTGNSTRVKSSATASSTTPYRASSPNCECSQGTAQVIKVLSASGSAIFYGIDSGADKRLTANYTYSGS